MGLFKNAASTAKSVYDEVTLYWKKPAKGNYVSYKELLNLGLGGMGQQLVTLLLGYMGLGATNTLLGSTLGIAPIHLTIMATVQTILNIIFTIVRSKIIDSTHTKIGRFRPYIAITGVPLVVLTGIFMFLPFETFSYTTKLVAVFCFTLALAFSSPFFSETYSNLISVITPRAEERTKVITINTFLFSLAPTITNLIIPLFANLFQGTYTNINLYRYVVVPIGLLGAGLNFFAAFGTKERAISSAKPAQNIRIWKDASSVFKNKYWWILNVAGLVGFAEGAFGVILSWVFIYGLQDMVAYSMVVTIMGSAATIGMALAPIVMLKFGNKKVLLGHNFCNIFLIIGMMLNYKNPMMFFVFYYLNTVINSLCLIYNPELYSEMKDYQQFIYRKRLDSTFAVSGLLLMPVSMLTGYFMPYIYESFGLTTNYNILYDPAVRNTLFYVICIISVIGAVVNLIPFFFFDMSSEKHKWIMNCIRLRTAATDKALGEITPHNTKEICEILLDYEELKTKTFDVEGAKAKLKGAKANKASKEELKQAKLTVKTYRRKVAEQKEIQVFTDELNRFEKPEMIAELMFCREITAFSENAFYGLTNSQIESLAAKAPNKKIRKKFVKSTRELHKCSMQTIHELRNAANILENSEKKLDKKTLKKAHRYSDLFEFYHGCAETCLEYEAMESFFDIHADYEAACKFVADEEAENQRKQEAEKNEKAQEKLQYASNRKK